MSDTGVSSNAGGAVEYVVAGLGNPGRKYDGSRHNAGFAAGDVLAARFGIPVKRLKFQSLYGLGSIAGKRVALLKPQTFMNLSGRAVRECLDFYKLPPERAVIIFDDAALPAGKVRVRARGSDGGHNGMRDIICQLRSDAVPRVKIGVGAPPESGYDMKDWVLSGFTESERVLISDAASRACDAVEILLSAGADEAMNRFN
ncbi:MAG: aminoacyl-tRNA hydrolase [Oscillospiraceae bacterium]|nr:aminoacyl-tRNA hydrolase [Oscillospiraceae bacterium]